MNTNYYLVKLNDSIIVQTLDSYFCFKIELNKNVKVNKFKILLSDFIGLRYDAHYIYTNDKQFQLLEKHCELGKEDTSILNGSELEEYVCEEISKSNASFSERNEFSKFKYIQRKRPKLCLDIMLFKPNISLIWKVMKIRCSNKICYLSFQDLARLTQLLDISGDSSKKVMLFETCQGLIVSTILNQTMGICDIIQVYHGDFPNRTCLEYLQFDSQLLNNLYSVNIKKLASLKSNSHLLELDNSKEIHENQEKVKENTLNRTLEERGALKILFNPEFDSSTSPIVNPSMDALIIASKFHPKDVVLTLLPFLKPSRPLAVYSQYRETLVDCYKALKRTESVINLEITETVLQYHQVLPGRTHPMINMDGHNGYILSGIHVDPSPP